MTVKTASQRASMIIGRSAATSSGCWQWQGPLHASGYARIRVGAGPQLYAHRVSYEAFVGPLLPGMEIDHLCRNRGCVNPAHLEQVTHRENGLRGTSAAARFARRTHCQHGHELSGPNVRMSGGERVCRRCDCRRQAEYKARKRAAAEVKP